jgi:glycosyltransferase involved in cell wall biosynthesis
MVLSPQEQSRYGDEVVFVGRSMILEASNLRKTVMTDLRMALKNLGRDPKQALVVLNEALNLQRMAKDTWILPTLIEQLVPGFSNISTEHDPLATLGEIAGAEYRAGIVASLPGIAVWGDAGWKTLESYGVRYRGEAGHFIELSRIYNNGGIHVDIGRIYQRDIVTLRVFEAAACGAFVLASWSPALRGCFKLGVELESWKNLAELKAKIAFYKANPEKRRAIAEAGRERVLKEHTTLQRVQQILAHMKLH